ncbi:hypothetical protein [Micromonospora haikouensis]|uniref:hypothetical protein n=1 Tax=Micromonospora haikouensis TaxID=686309 RepID=UPI003D725B7A
MPADPLFINESGGSPEYNAAELRRAFGMLASKAGTVDRFGARSGVHPAGGPALTLSGTTLTVGHLQAVMYPAASSTQGPYLVQLPQHTWSVPAAAAQPRKDLVVLRVWDNDEDGSGDRKCDTQYVTGSAAPSPSEPATPAGAMRLGVIDVPASGGGNPNLTYVAPWTVATGGVLPVRTAADLPTTGVYEGMYADVADVNQLVRWSSAAWDVVAEVPTAYNTYTPAFSGHGSASFSTLTGRWKRISYKTVHFIAYWVVSTAGTGTGNVTITAPTSIDRTVRQSVMGNLEGAASPSLRHVAAVSFTGGTGAVFDRLRFDSGGSTNSLSNLTGADLASGMLGVIQGIYMEA